jgi:hypothetical protein
MARRHAAGEDDRPQKERRAMTATAKKVYDGLTEHVSTDNERERIRHTLYRTDASALASIVPTWQDHWTDAEVEQYRTDGYLAMDGLLTPDEVELAKAALADIAYRRVWNEKVGIHGAEKPWHQDTAYFDYTPLGGVIGVWIALDEATVENGCMQVIPGSHQDGPAKHYHVRDCQLEDGGVKIDRAVVVPLKPGGALFFSGLIHHGTPPNTSGDRRRALQFHYAAADCTRMTIRQHGELFDDNGAYAGCRDWDLEAGMSRAKIEI